MLSCHFLRLVAALTLAAILLLISPRASAGSATWNSNPASGVWNHAGNWTPATVPDNPTDVATFATSTVTDVSFSADVTTVDGIFFDANASAFTITLRSTDQFILDGMGITNASVLPQSFV